MVIAPMATEDLNEGIPTSYRSDKSFKYCLVFQEFRFSILSSEKKKEGIIGIQRCMPCSSRGRSLYVFGDI